MRGQSIEGTITDIDEKGRGVFEHASQRIHTWFAFPGDTVRVRIVQREKKEWIGKREELVAPSPDRLPPRCDHAEKTGNCFWQVIRYDQQLAWKQALVQQAFDRHRLGIPILLPRPSPQTFGYRNKMEYAIGTGPVIGFREPKKWWSLVDIAGCYLQSEGSFPLLQAVKGYLQDHDIAPWHLRSHTGFARYLLVREGKFTGERMAVLITAAGELPHRQDLMDRLAGHVTSLYWGINPTLSDTTISQKLVLLQGKELLCEQIGDLTYFIHPHAFFQNNSYLAVELVQTVLEFADLAGHERVLDLYCGGGLLSLPLARRASQVLGIESDPTSIACAQMNREANGVENVQFLQEKVESCSWADLPQEVAVVDPPRSGLHPKVLQALVERGPDRLIYVSCNHQALASELTALLTAYTCEAVRLLDLFPHTPHVEVLARLVRMRRSPLG
ncbi:MAG: 23S rRNA (uracil(1939)-C(5))-methyltransferase RlmD [Candidatus Tectomicrobia bacterium]|uniref:23S rRNA (Uracil(1939)-C(5))-methyltransferase RlmD n=1 Tax=Tectimicrobiota bacterium TaxID=2528274 RepID=A0A932CME7_UNCTE|nr:23S rRNA (uracil(1939)-C(5))-methyltransferase RlmD [Candidatus Tectomicrobia bacterium]